MSASDGSDDSSQIPGYGFLSALSDVSSVRGREGLKEAIRQHPAGLAAAAVALIVLVRDPVLFVREYIIDGFLVYIVETIIRGFFGLLGQIGAELQLVASQFWNATFGVLVGIGGDFMSDVAMPLVTGIQAMLMVGLANLGVAAPLAAAISIFLTMLLVSISAIVGLEVLRWLLPIDALIQPVVNTAQGARSVLSRLPLIGSRGDS